MILYITKLFLRIWAFKTIPCDPRLKDSITIVTAIFGPPCKQISLVMTATGTWGKIHGVVVVLCSEAERKRRNLSSSRSRSLRTIRSRTCRKTKQWTPPCWRYITVKQSGVINSRIGQCFQNDVRWILQQSKSRSYNNLGIQHSFFHIQYTYNMVGFGGVLWQWYRIKKET